MILLNCPQAIEDSLGCPCNKIAYFVVIGDFVAHADKSAQAGAMCTPGASPFKIFEIIFQILRVIFTVNGKKWKNNKISGRALIKVFLCYHSNRA